MTVRILYMGAEACGPATRQLLLLKQAAGNCPLNPAVLPRYPLFNDVIILLHNSSCYAWGSLYLYPTRPKAGESKVSKPAWSVFVVSELAALQAVQTGSLFPLSCALTVLHDIYFSF